MAAIFRTVTHQLRSLFQGPQWRRRERWSRAANSRRPRVEVLEDRWLPTVTAVAESFATTPNTPTALQLLPQDVAASNEPVSLALVLVSVTV